MGTVIITKDGKREYISRDRHLYDLIRAYIGDDAAEYFQGRIEDMENLFDELKTILEAHQEGVEDALEVLKNDVEKVRWDA